MTELPPLPPIDTEEQRAALYRANRRRHATLPGRSWPDGVLAECERLDAAHPGWAVSWLDENRTPGWERPAGFSALRVTGYLVGGDEMRRGRPDGVPRRPQVFGVDVAELEERIAAVEKRVATDDADLTRMLTAMDPRR